MKWMPAIAIVLLACGAELQAVTIPTVPVGNAGNANDAATGGYGGVNYAYSIGKTEVTMGQYTEFLNSVAATDTYGLYSTWMADLVYIAGITRNGVPGNYSYSVVGSAQRPVSYVSWGDAARFANWLHNGQPTGLQDASTTEDGAYSLNGATTDAELLAVSRNSGAKWFLPTENEWYKAAYHKNDGVTGNYWSYPTSTNVIPYSDQPPGSDAPVQSNTANFYRNDTTTIGYDDGWAINGSTIFPSGNVLTDVGAYTASTSPYGTFDQAGNVMEWNEAIINRFGTHGRGVRGGSFGSDAISLKSDLRVAERPRVEDIVYGFRVATLVTVPEPSTYVMAAMGILALLFARRRTVR